MTITNAGRNSRFFMLSLDFFPFNAMLRCMEKNNEKTVGGQAAVASKGFTCF